MESQRYAFKARFHGEKALGSARVLKHFMSTHGHGHFYLCTRTSSSQNNLLINTTNLMEKAAP